MDEPHITRVQMRRETPAEKRRFNDDQRRLNALIGQLVRSWALLHESMAAIFHGLVAESSEASFRPSVGFAIWHSCQSDLGQRKMLEAALSAKIALNEGYNWRDERKYLTQKYERYIWLINEITKKSHSRNDFVHSPIVFNLGLGDAEHEAIVFDWTANPRAKKLSGKDLFQFCDYCIDFCEKASLHLTLLGNHRPEHGPLPDKPQWLSLSQFPSRKQPPRRKPQRQHYRPQPPSPE